MKLWVDDIRNAPDDTWSVARTVTSALDFIRIFSDEITDISLDHDISIQIETMGVSRPYPSPETFKSVALYIVAKYKHCTTLPTVYIHSANPIGAESMRSLLVAYGFNPQVKALGSANRLELEV